MKRIISALLVLVMVLGMIPMAAFAADMPTVTLTADKTEVVKGEEITLTLSIDQGITDAYVWQWDIVWNSDLFEVVSMARGTAYNKAAVNKNSTLKTPEHYNSGSVTSGNTPAIHQLKAGSLCTLTLKAKEDITEDTEAQFYIFRSAVTTGVEEEVDGNWIVNFTDHPTATDYDWGTSAENGPADGAEGLKVAVKKEATPEVPTDPNTITLEGNPDIGSVVFENVTVKESTLDTTGDVVIDVILDKETAMDATVRMVFDILREVSMSTVVSDMYSPEEFAFTAGTGSLLFDMSLINGWGRLAFDAGEKTYYITLVVDGIDLNCEHDWAAPTCTEPGACTKCGKPNEAPLGHSFADFKCTVCGAPDMPFALSVGEVVLTAGEECDEQYSETGVNVKVTVPAGTETLTVTPTLDAFNPYYEVYVGKNDYHQTRLTYNFEEVSIDLAKYNNACVYIMSGDLDVAYHLTIEEAQPETPPADPNTIVLEGNGDIGSFTFGDVTVKESKVTTTDGEVLMEVTLDAATALNATVKVTANTVSGFLILSPVEEDGYSTFGNTFYTGPGACNGTAALTAGRGGFICRANEVDYRIHFTVDGAPDPEPEKIPVQSVTLNETEKQLSANAGEFKLSATITPSNATNQTVVWETSNASVATVTDGLVKAVGAGTATITATVDGVSASCEVTVYDPASEFPFSLTVDGKVLTPVSDGTEECMFGGIMAKWIVTVPAEAKSMGVSYDYESMSIWADDDGDQLCDSAAECTVDLTKGYKFLDIVGESRNEYYHLYIEFAEPETPPAAPGYTFATSADVSAENGENVVVKVNITGHSNPEVTTYNAYDVTLTYDNEKLEYVNFDGAVKSDNGQVEVDKENGTIRIVGCGADKDFGTEIAALTFKTKGEGEANVTISKVQVSDKDTAVDDNIPEASAKHDEDDTTADATPDVSVVVVPYTVTKPTFVSGNDKVLHGESYTFSYTDTTNYTYSGLAVTVGGTVVTPTEADGVYTIANVTGTVVITANQTANSYAVTKPENVTGPDQAIYGEDYKFTVTPSTDMAIDTVTVKYEDGSDVPYTVNETGEYVIAGDKISGPFTITVTETNTKTTINFVGIEKTEIEGGEVTVSAEIGKDFTFKLIKEAAYSYTVKVGETELNESTTTAGQYTIPANLVIAGGVTVNITKADSSKVTVDVHEYINLDGKAMFLVTAKWRDKVLAYGEGNTMFYSSKYTVTGYEEAGAYCWLVVSTDEMNTKDAVKTAAESAIVEAAAGTTAAAVKYNYDINGTTKVDVNDAQLAYDMYNASYMEFTGNLPMLKFLEADMSTNMKLDVNDVAAIISYIVSGAAG